MSTALPTIPRPGQFWRPVAFWIHAAFALLLLAAIPKIVVDYWFLENLGQAGVFRTNFSMQLVLFAGGVGLFALAVVVPVRCYAASPGLRRAAVAVGLWIGILAGGLWSTRYEQYLLWLNAGSFGEVDPLFGHDVGFYVFVLPAIETTRLVVTCLAGVAAVAAIAGRYNGLASSGVLARADRSLRSRLSLLVTNGLNGTLFCLGLSLVARTFLARYGLLVKDNGETGVRTGAAYLDVAGVFSNLNMIYVSTVVELGIMAVVGYSLYRARQQGFRLRRPMAAVAGLLALDLAFFLAVVVNNAVFVAANEPTVQIPYIERHIAATLRAYGLEDIETVDWRPPEEPLGAEQLLASRTIQQAPLLPARVSRLEEPPDLHHLERVQAGGGTLVYGPMLQIYEQEQQLRPYYRFMSVDPVRYEVGGEPQMYVSAVRELPSRGVAGPREWLRHWGSAALMYTHGLGLVMSPVNALEEEGGPLYAARDVPPSVSEGAFEAEPRIYFGEGARDDYILTDIRYLRELDYATRQFRTEAVHDGEPGTGIRVDSWTKRLLLAFRTRDIKEFLFSRFIDPERTRVHFYRTPIQRLRKVAPFLFLDSNVYAFVADGRILWMVNGLTTTDRYPYAFPEVLGDKAEERAVEPLPERVVNYAEDSVKITLDAYSGEVRFYKIAGDPIIDAWQRIYPGLFEPASAMPASVEAQLTYPLQWFHIQFDDIYKRYHQRHPIEFYNAEDLWDDADEVLGSIGQGLAEFGTSDQATFSYEGYPILLDPADLPAGANGGAPGELQFAMLMPFTPEGARNLRSLIVAFQDPGQYGRLLNLRIPQGVYVEGPEQADALIDDDAQVNQQMTLWVRHGSEVVRGHTLLLPVGGDLIYVEPLWIASLQNRLPQIKLLSVVYRGRTTMATSLPDAILLLDITEAEEQLASELPWFAEAQAGGR